MAELILRQYRLASFENQGEKGIFLQERSSSMMIEIRRVPAAIIFGGQRVRRYFLGQENRSLSNNTTDSWGWHGRVNDE